MQKKIILYPYINIFFSIFQEKKYICLKNDLYSFYLKIPSNLLLKKNNNCLIVHSNVDINKNTFYLFSSIILNFLKRIKKPFTKRLVLKGLGFKVNFITKFSIQLKLGFSHLINIQIPNGITLLSSKNFITVLGLNKSIVGNIANIIKKKRMPDVYKGKGIYYKNEKVLLKSIKKS